MLAYPAVERAWLGASSQAVSLSPGIKYSRSVGVARRFAGRGGEAAGGEGRSERASERASGSEQRGASVDAGLVPLAKEGRKRARRRRGHLPPP